MAAGALLLILGLAASVTACDRAAADPTSAALATALEAEEGGGSRARLDYYRVSPDRTLYCGHAWIGGRSSVFAIRWNPEHRGTPEVLRQPSIDKAPPELRDRVRREVMRVSSQVSRICRQEGAPLGAP